MLKKRYTKGNQIDSLNILITKIISYAMPGTLFVISAPSGAGKTSLVLALLKHRPGLSRLITYTTRSPRAGEVNGCDYHFITESDFKLKIEQNFFLEWSCAYGAYYGSPRSLLDDIRQGQSFIAIVDRLGARALHKLITSAVCIWIVPPSLSVLERRLTLRASDCQERIRYRLQLARQEMEQERIEPFFQFVIVNDSFEEALHA